ncbi:MAG TPA: SDR family NAD(P)-dependent oxidoreductase, partial [Mycobacterium sp.]|nr:SDR family NAD(P)-dependent oxidoreductase [Mycobacterium sp.]
SAALARDAAQSVKTYPANYFRSFSRDRREQYVDVPVQLVVNTADPYVRPYGFDVTARWVPRLWRRDLKAGHWSPMSHPQALASAVRELADFVEGEPPSRALLRAQVGRKGAGFSDTLVSITGAGSGIGRATALAFAAEGAEIVVSDIDEAAAKDTAAQVTARGGIAYPYVLDVTDAEAVEAFAEQVSAEHGVPDIVINNAGIGRATALAFAAEGAEIVVSDIDEAAAKDTAAQITARGGVAYPYVLDVTDADAVEAFAEQVSAERGVPDIVINNAGIGHAGRFLDTPPERFDRVLDVNFGGVVNGCRAFGRRLVERGTGGHIVNVASMAAYTPSQHLNAYCTSKAAVYMFSDCLRAELDAAGVGLTTICPGVINTNIVGATRFDAPPGTDERVEGRRAQIQHIYAVRRYGPEKVAKAILSAVRKDKPIRPVAPEAYLLYGLSRAVPQALRSTARARVM